MSREIAILNSEIPEHYDYQSIAEEITSMMMADGTYKDKYGHLISTLSGMLHEYWTIRSEYVYSQDGEDHYMYATATKDGGQKRSPALAAMESLRKDILAYSTQLLLTPKAERESPNGGQQRRSRLEELLDG